MKSPLSLFLLFVFSISFSTIIQAQEKTGWMKLYTNQDDFYLVINHNFDQIYRINSGDSVMVEAGVTQLLMVGPNFNDYKTTINVLPNTTTIKRVNFNFHEVPQSSWDVFKERLHASTSLDKDTATINPNISSYSEVILNQVHNHLDKGFIKFNFEQDSVITELGLKSQLDSVYLVIDFRNDRALKIADGDSVKLQSGGHVFEFFHPFRGMNSANYFVYSDSVRQVDLVLPIDGINLLGLNKNLAAHHTFNTNTFILTDAETDIYLKEEYLGTGSILMNLPPGQEAFELRNPEFGSKIVMLDIPETELLATNQHILPSRKKSSMLGILPGASQFYKKQYVKSGAFIVGSALLLNQTIKKHSTYTNEQDYFDNLLEEYNAATDEETALRLGDLTDNQRQIVQDADNSYRFFAASTIAYYALNVIDAFFSKPSGGFRQEHSVRFYLSRHLELPREYTSATVQVNF